MQVISPDVPLVLWIAYSENNIPITGLTDLTITIYDEVNNIILATTPLVENISMAGFYSYSANISNIAQLTNLFVYYKKGNDVINLEKYYVDIESDNIGKAF